MLKPLFAFLLLLAALPAQAATGLKPEELPRSLQDWLPWAQQGHEQERCPSANGGGERACVWPALLQLQASAQGARFRYEVQVYGAPTRVRLPGEAGAWPQGVRANGQPLAVLEQEAGPSSLLAPGRHVIEGEFNWPTLPQDLQTPPGVALLQLSLDGQPVRRQADAQGRLWLRAAPDAEQAPSGDSTTVRTLRLLEDGIPMQMTTQFVLIVSGKPREISLPLALLPGWQAAQIDSPLPTRLQDDGSLRVQARPGTWTVQLQSRSLQSLQALQLPKGGVSADEVWAFAAQNELRGVTLSGAAAIDPRQVEMPDDWRQHPAFRLAGGEGLVFKENRRGSAAPEADSVKLVRTLWLDFDGGGFTVQDRLIGDFNRSTRLSLQAPGVLGRVSVEGEDQLITQLDKAKGEQGFELRQTRTQVEADSRIEGGARSLSAVGWNVDVEGARAELRLPPGWKLLHAGGADRAQGSWVAGWTLWDLFFLLLALVAAGRIAGWQKGGLLGLALLTGWQLAGSPPTWLWLLLLGLMALQAALPLQPGSSSRRATAAAWLGRLRWSVVGLMGLLLLAFAVDQVRLAMYPSLERSWQTAGLEAPAESAEAPPFMPIPESQVSDRREVARAMSQKRASAVGSRYESPKPMSEVDPKARVQTGPGLPNWQWHSHNLEWQGPVQASQQLQLWLLPPWATALWRLLALGLLAAALWQLARHGLPPSSGRRWFGAAALAAAAVGSPSTQAAKPAPAPQVQVQAQETLVPWPSSEQLAQLRQRVNPAPSCLPQCAGVARAWLSASGARVALRLEVHTQAAVAVPLPGQGTNWQPSRVLLDGQPLAALRRDAQGQLWASLPAGVSQLALEAEVGNASSVDIALPLPLRELRTELTGWVLSGLDARGLPGAALSLAREAQTGAKAEDSGTQRDALPPLVRVERHLRLGLEWTVQTRIERLSSSRAPLTVRFRLLPGERVTDSAVQVQDGIASVPFGAEGERLIESALAVQPQLQLEASREAQQLELWTLATSGQWHVGLAGIPPVARQVDGRWAPQWQPWPGEKVQLSIAKPAGLSGQTLTLDRVNTTVQPGQRATDVQASLSLRASLGGEHVLSLPAGSELLGLSLNGQNLPLQAQGGRVALPLTPGSHQVNLSWRQAEGMGTWLQTPALGLGQGLQGVNDRLTLQVPQDRVVLLAGGPRLGPAVLLWGVLIVALAAAALLHRLPNWPLGIVGGSLLAIGLAPASLEGLALVLGWFLLLRQRPQMAPHLGRGAHNALQLLIALWTVLALFVLLNALRVGLLGYPELLIAGNGSSARELHWYTDRVASETHTAWVISAPLWLYRVLMLAWALWLANALMGHVRWAWAQFGDGTLWRARPSKAAPAAPAVDDLFKES